MYAAQMVRKIAPVGQGAGTFQGVEVQGAAALAAVGDRRGRPAALTAEQRSDIVRRYVDGAAIREVAAAVGRSYGTVHRVLTEEGVAMRSRSGR